MHQNKKSSKNSRIVGIKSATRRLLVSFTAAVFVVTGLVGSYAPGVSAQTAPPASTVCSGSTAPPTTYGQVRQTINVATGGTYRVWSRIKAPDAASNSYSLQVDGDAACNVGASATMPINDWTWVNYRSGDTTNSTYKTLTAGSHTLTYTGRDAGVQLDRVLLLGDYNCIPTGTGDNCAVTDVSPPIVSVTAPTTGTTVSGTARAITATASDASGIAKVEYVIDGVVKTPADTITPYSFTWDTTTVPNGAHTVAAKATDTAGNTATSAAISVTVSNTTTDTTPPTITLSAAPTTISAGQSTTLTAAAADNIGVAKVEFYNGTTLLSTDTTGPSYSFVWTPTNSGTKTPTAKAYDAAGNVTTSAAVSVNVLAVAVDSTPPSVALTAPATGASIAVGTSVVVSATASDNVGVTKVQFYDGTTLIGEDISAPYSLTWNTLGATAGTHSLTARAYDGAGNIANSTVIGVSLTSGTVNGPGDVNGDARVNALDLSALISNDGTNYPPADFNNDGTVGAADMAILLSKWTW